MKPMSGLCLGVALMVGCTFRVDAVDLPPPSDLSGMADAGQSSDGSDAGPQQDFAGTPDGNLGQPDLAPPAPTLAATNPFKNGVDDMTVGACTSRRVGQDFVAEVSGELMTLRLQLRKIGTPSDSVQVKLYEGGSAPQAGTFLVTSQPVSSADIVAANTSPGPTVEFLFPGGSMLKQGMHYFFVVERTGQLDCDEIDMYRVGNSTDQYPDAHAWVQWNDDTAAAWQAQDLSKFDLTFQVVVQP